MHPMRKILNLVEAVTPQFYAIVVSIDGYKRRVSVGKFGPFPTQLEALQRGALAADKWEFIVHRNCDDFTPDQMIEWANSAETSYEFDAFDEGTMYEFDELEVMDGVDVNAPDEEVKGFPSYFIGNDSNVIVAMDVNFQP